MSRLFGFTQGLKRSFRAFYDVGTVPLPIGSEIAEQLSVLHFYRSSENEKKNFWICKNDKMTKFDLEKKYMFHESALLKRISSLHFQSNRVS